MSTAPSAPPAQPRARKTAAARKKKPQVRVTNRARAEGDRPGTGHWRVYFLEHLVQTSNVRAAAAYARVAPSRAYRTRKQDADFARAWDAALAEGYRDLEMDLLAYLRNPSPDHRMDVASAIRLLTLHRQSVAQSRAAAEDEDEQAALDSIEAMIAEMRAGSAETPLPDDSDRADGQA
ncbi:MAG: hypothetical protein ACK4YM_04795 [Novosphingobium sp.]